MGFIKIFDDKSPKNRKRINDSEAELQMNENYNGAEGFSYCIVIRNDVGRDELVCECKDIPNEYEESFTPIKYKVEQYFKERQCQLEEHEKAFQRNKAEIERSFNERENSLVQQEAKMKREYMEYKAKLEQREAEINQAFEMKTKQLEIQVAELEEARKRYEAERKLWNDTCCAEKKGEVDYDAILSEVRQSFSAVKEAMDNAKDSVLGLKDTIRDGCADGVTELCELCRKLSFDKDEEYQMISNRISVILMSEFGAVPIEPVVGEKYDPTIHERLDTAHNGDFIQSCLSRGWSLNGKMILRALVETQEGGSF